MVITEKHIQILDKAEELFAEKGYDGTTVRDIAKSADVNLAKNAKLKGLAVNRF